MPDRFAFSSFRRPWASAIVALLLGVAHAFAFAPWGNGWLQLAVLTGFALLVLRGGGFLAGLLFGIGWFSAGVGWVYVSMHEYGGVPAPLAAVAVVLFAGYLGLYPALGALLCRRLCRRPRAGAWTFVPAFAGTFTLAELARGWVLTGFPWLGVGYAHVDGPLAGFAPVGGVYLVTMVAASVAASVAALVQRVSETAAGPDAGSSATARLNALAAGFRAAVMPALVAVALMAVGAGLRMQVWSEPAGEPVSVSLLQGNIAQAMKFDPEFAAQARHQYLQMIEDAPADFVLLPETAWTTAWENTESSLKQRLYQFIFNTDSTVALGLPRFTAVPMQPQEGPARQATDRGDGQEAAHDEVRWQWQVSNSVEVFTREAILGPSAAGSVQRSGRYHYDKRHLVPFGEFVPEGFHWFMNIMQIPLGDQARGAAQQPLLPLKGQRIGFNICYEDIFGEELLDQVRAQPADAAGPGPRGDAGGAGEDSASGTPGATILANLTNLGWFGNSHALPQHLQIARMRALETARPIIRATNTGTTAVIDAQGAVQAQLPTHQVGTLKASVQGHVGLTPYARLGGNLVVWLLAAGLVLVAMLPGRRGRTGSAQSSGS